MEKDINYLEAVKKLQQGEITERLIYLKLEKSIRKEEDRKVLMEIADAELRHYEIWKAYTKVDVRPNRMIVFWYVLIGRLLGYTFALKLMEKSINAFNNGMTRRLTDGLKERITDVDIILKDEEEHEETLLEMIDEDKLQYIGSMVLGLNDALVEFTGSLAGWTFAMQSNRLILLAGLITGISATLSMASSEYLSAKNDNEEHPLKAAVYTGIAYLATVLLLILPYGLLPDQSYTAALLIMLVMVIVIIAGFNYYIAVAKNLSFRTKFKEMSIISLSVAFVSFIIGLLVKQFLGIEI
ncbi:VIT1/CCC1 transporter family protein [Proteiniclasticum sp.]|uniref:VIT1/CCC1 transporter family protein n=1 Tax=Proteiniclasticum sp. TaxID=2053595 RepID=UPI00289ED475|nr:VIT1/CCC1 transporter family protein [Proteiniclasticum sp.]